MSRLEEIDTQIAALQKERAELAKTEGAPVIFELLKPLFEYPGIESVYWTQYTPYFNDGDPCEFGVRFEPYFNYDTEEGGYVEDQDQVFDAFSIPYKLKNSARSYEDLPGWQKQSTTEEQWNEYLEEDRIAREQFIEQGWTIELAEKIHDDSKRIGAWMDEHEGFMLDAFGDHCYVLFKADGSFETDEYDHDLKETL